MGGRKGREGSGGGIAPGKEEEEMGGVKTYYCSDLCEIRKCAVGRGYETCRTCAEIEICPKVAMIWRNNPQARTNLIG